VLDLIASNQDEILASLGIPLPNFLAAYKGANNLQGIPTPTINFNFQEELNHANGTPNLGEEETPIPPDGTPARGDSPAQQVTRPTPGYGALVVLLGGNQPESQINDNKEYKQEMVDATNAVESAAIGGRATICRLIFDAIVKGTIEPICKFHAQRKENDEIKRIKAAFTLPRLNEAAKRVAFVITNEPPAQMPVLRGLVDESTTKATSAMERHIKSLEDQLKATTDKKAKKSKGDGKKKEKKGTPAAPKKTNAPKAPRNVQDVNNKDTAHAKGKEKNKGRKKSSDGKKAVKPTKSRK
jgi:hypothetical protein